MPWFSKGSPPPSDPPSPPAPHPQAPAPTPAALACSFCGKSQKEVKKLIAGPSAYICDECIETSKQILEDEEAAAFAPPPVPAPADLEIAMDEHVVGQRPAKRALVALLRRHLLTSAHPGSEERAPRVLLVGPSGSGKTSFGRALCAVSGLPSVLTDVSRLSESGYVGEDVENLIGDLLVHAEDSATAAQRGLMFLDGLEKLKAERPLAQSRDISGEGVQRELLRLLDGFELGVPLGYRRRHPQREVEHLSCLGVFIAASARLDPLPPGASDRALRAALAATGILPEVLARFDRIVPLPLPDADTLLSLLHHAKGPLAAARRVVEALGGTLALAPGAARALADAAALSAGGAWMMGRIIDRQLEDILVGPAPGRAWVIDEARMSALLAEALG